MLYLFSQKMVDMFSVIVQKGKFSIVTWVILIDAVDIVLFAFLSGLILMKQTINLKCQSSRLLEGISSFHADRKQLFIYINSLIALLINMFFIYLILFNSLIFSFFLYWSVLAITHLNTLKSQFVYLFVVIIWQKTLFMSSFEVPDTFITKIIIN